ncbi:uncharacterized protein LOC130901713 isoform X1 [Diorhabda carinulata]|uniref:uncharacterized protein LOC130901713 isoform X1 n=1 Tax=Diorhabda carinulata TaxID=1163345 RepID=UPI0025A27BB0|nr:uncharacterized protein LOC130901713 isoform X1 [Diorhabda carinulata]
MFFFIAIIFLTHTLRITALSDSESDLMKYKTDLDQIGNDVENFLYDISKDILKKADKFVGIDYGSGYEDDVEDESEKEKNKNKINKEKIEVFTTPATVNVIEDYTEAENERKKRSVLEDYPSGNILTVAETPDCIDRTESFDDQSLNEIKQELRKLTELTILLKDQQKILSELNKEGNNINNDLSDEYNPRDLIHLLKTLENDRKSIKPKAEKQKIFDKLKMEIQKAISALNETNDERNIQKGRELVMETKIKQQNEDIVALKILVKQLLNQTHIPHKENNKSTDKIKDIETNDEIVGLPLFLPQTLPKFIPKVENKKHLRINNIAQERSRQDKPIVSNVENTEKLKKDFKKVEFTTKDRPIVNKVNNKTEEKEPIEPRSSSAEKEIVKFLDEVIEPHNSNLEDKIRELEVNLSEENKEKSLKQQLSILRRLIKKERDEPSSKSLFEDDSGEDEDIQFLKRLQIAMRALGKESSKPERKLDVGIETRLQQLQTEIENLKPKEEITIPIQKNIPQNKGLLDELKEDKQPSRLSADQLRQLRSKIDELLQKEKSDNDHIIPSSNPGINFSPQMYPNLDSKRDWLPYPLWIRGQQFLNTMAPPFLDYRYQPNNPYYYSEFTQPPLDGFKPMGIEPIPAETPKLIEPSVANFRNQFFPVPHTFPGRDFKEFGYYPEEPAGYGLPPPGHYQTEVNYNDLKKSMSINDLKSEILNLESILSTMNTPHYNEKYGDKVELEQLQQQVKGLKVIINSITDDIKPNQMYPQHSPTNKNYRSTRSIDSTTQKVLSNTQVDDSVTSKLRQYFLEEDMKVRSAHYNELKDRLSKIKYQLGETASKSPKQIEYWPFEKYQDTFKYPTFINEETRTVPFHTSDLENFEKEDIITNIIVKIVGKIVAAIPQILGKLFGVGTHSLFANADKSHGNDYGYTYDNNYSVSNDNYNLQSVFSKLGIFGYIPIVLLNIINAVATFCKLIRKNQFFTNFIVPTLVLLLVAGGVVFLIWWLQPDVDSNNAKQIDSIDKYATSSTNYLYDNYERHSGNNNYRKYYNSYSYYRTPWHETYLRNVDNKNTNLLSGAYYRSYFDDGSKRV